MTLDPVPVTIFSRTRCSFTNSTPLLQILGEKWTIGDAIEGVQIFGGSGSGKTSGSGQTLAKTYLYNRFGGLILTVKAGDAVMWKEYAQQIGRLDDLKIVDTENGYYFNFLYYMVQEGFNTTNITHVLLSALHKVNDDDYWHNAMEQLIKNSVSLLVLATGTLSIADLYKLINYAPKSLNEAKILFEETNDTFFSQIIQSIENKLPTLSTAMQIEYLELTKEYWQQEFPSMDPEPRSSIISMFTSLADNLMRGELRNLLSCTPEIMNLRPEDTFDGSIILFNLNLKQFRKTGRIAQLIFKTVFQLIVEMKREHITDPKMRPIFLWIDEAQFFLTQDDVLFQTTARASKVCSVYLTQNYSNYLAFVGSQREKATVDSFLAVLQTKFFHCQSDLLTNDYATSLFGKDYSPIISRNQNIVSSTINQTTQTTLELKIQPWHLDQLSKGGEKHNFRVEAFVYQSGRVWESSQSNFGLVEFDQNV
jgi:hypothetical protein